MLGATLLAHALLLAWGAWVHSPTHSEVQQLPAGLAILQFGRFDLAQVNPPLVRLLAALPVAALSPTTDWQHYSSAHIDRADYSTAFDFIQANGERVRLLFFAARLACIPLSVLGAYVCYRWARELYGTASGLVAAWLWCFSPIVLGHSQLMSADMAAAALGGSFGYSAWKWLREPTWRRAAVAGLSLGLAQLTKFTCLVFVPLLILWWLLISPVGSRGVSTPLLRRGSIPQLTVVLALSLYIINLGYAFESTPTRLGEHFFFSEPLHSVGRSYSDNTRNVLQRCVATVPLPLPLEYFNGLDAQKAYFKDDALCFLRGEWKRGGWWYYYLYAFAIKTPVGTLCLLVMAGAVSVWSRRFWADGSISWRDELLLISAVVSLVVLVSMHTSLHVHLRYVFPALPFMFVWCSKVGAVAAGERKLFPLVAGLTLWSTAGSLWFYPHGLSYFNELVGGPSKGHYHLLASNIDWGQDLWFLKDWVDKHPEARPLGLASAALYNPSDLGIDWVPPPKCDSAGGHKAENRNMRGPEPGWYAISVNDLHLPEGSYDYFLECEPVDRAGYSMYIYHLGIAGANRVRRAAKLPELPPEWEEKKRANGEYQARFVESLVNPAAAEGGPSRPVRVALFCMKYENQARSAAELQRIVDSESSWACELVDCDDIQKRGLKEYDVFLAPGGAARLMADALGTSGQEVLRGYVREGGGYVGICAGAFLATERYLGLVEARPLVADVDVVGGRRVSMAERGEGYVTMELTAAGERVLGGPSGLLGVKYTGGPVFSADYAREFPSYVPLAIYRTEVAQYEPQRGTMIQTPAVITGLFGQGRVILFGPHAESTKELEPLVRRAILTTARRSRVYPVP